MESTMRRSTLLLPLFATSLAVGCPGATPIDGGVDDACVSDGGAGDGGLAADGGVDAGGPSEDAGTDDGGAVTGEDGGSHDLANTAAVEACPSMDAWPSSEIPEDYQRLVFADELRAVIVYRTYAGQGAGFTAVYEAGGFGLDLGNADGASCVTDPDDLGYIWSHHNWNDGASAVIGGVTWKLDISYQPARVDPINSNWEWAYLLTAVDENDEIVEGPYYLTLVSGLN